MSGGYVFIAGILLYFVLLRTLDSRRVSPLKAAAMWAIGYYALGSCVLAIEYAAKDMPVVANIFEPMRVVVATVQFAVAVYVFYRVEAAADDYMSYTAWGGCGLALIFFAVPLLVQQVVAAIIY